MASVDAISKLNADIDTPDVWATALALIRMTPKQIMWFQSAHIGSDWKTVVVTIDFSRAKQVATANSDDSAANVLRIEYSIPELRYLDATRIVYKDVTATSAGTRAAIGMAAGIPLHKLGSYLLDVEREWKATEKAIRTQAVLPPRSSDESADITNERFDRTGKLGVYLRKRQEKADSPVAPRLDFWGLVVDQEEKTDEPPQAATGEEMKRQMAARSMMESVHSEVYAAHLSGIAGGTSETDSV